MVVVLVVIVVQPYNHQTAPRAPAVSPEPTSYTDYDYLLGLFEPISGMDKLQDTTTSQYKGMNWLLYEDPATYDIRTADAQAIT